VACKAGKSSVAATRPRRRWSCWRSSWCWRGNHRPRGNTPGSLLSSGVTAQVRRSDHLRHEGEASRFRWLGAPATAEVDPRGEGQPSGLMGPARSPQGWPLDHCFKGQSLRSVCHLAADRQFPSPAWALVPADVSLTAFDGLGGQIRDVSGSRQPQKGLRGTNSDCRGRRAPALPKAGACPKRGANPRGFGSDRPAQPACSSRGMPSRKSCPMHRAAYRHVLPEVLD